jgi:hypothetical protein
MKLLYEIIEVGEGTEAAIAAELKKSNQSVRDIAIDLLKRALEKDTLQMQQEIGLALEKIKNTDQKETNEYKEALKRVKKFVDEYSASAWKVSSWCEVNGGAALIQIDDDYLNPLQKYTELIDQKILRLFQLAAKIVENLVMQADDLVKEAHDLIKEAHGLIKKADDLEMRASEQLKEARQQLTAILKDHELTLMFTTLIPLIGTSFLATKLYQWTTTRDYSSIRIALADVNALLIEAADHLDDHDYGRLVYLISKLRHTATYLKDSLANEFLHDVSKLESKQYSAQTKHGIVENMFNKYAFLGKIAI